MQPDFLVLRAYHFLADNSLQSADRDQQENRAVAEKPHNTVVKFDTYRNLQRHRADLPAVTRHLVTFEHNENLHDCQRLDRRAVCVQWAK